MPTIDELMETNRRLNRRCQEVESENITLKCDKYQLEFEKSVLIKSLEAANTHLAMLEKNYAKRVEQIRNQYISRIKQLPESDRSHLDDPRAMSTETLYEVTCNDANHEWNVRQTLVSELDHDYLPLEDTFLSCDPDSLPKIILPYPLTIPHNSLNIFDMDT